MIAARLYIAAAAIALAAGAQAQTPIPPPAKDFAMVAAQSDQCEIDAGRTAAVQALDPRVRACAGGELHIRPRPKAEGSGFPSAESAALVMGEVKAATIMQKPSLYSARRLHEVCHFDG
jgi:hypothetical protein